MAPSLLEKFLNRGNQEARNNTGVGAKTASGIKNQAVNALDQATMHDRLGPAKHLLALTLTDAGLREYLTANKGAADAIEYCYYRFANREIPAELQYMGNEISKVLQGYAVELLGKDNVNGVRKLIRAHLAGFRGMDSAIRLFGNENTAMLLSKMKDTLDLIESQEEDFISQEKSDHLLQGLGMYLQNHYSVDSYLSYDSKPNGKAWSDETKFALSYLSSDIPLDRPRLDLLSAYVRKTTVHEDGEDQIKPEGYTTERENEIRAQLFAADVQYETLNHGLDLLSKKMAGLGETVRETLITRFKTRHAEYWKPLKERVQKLTASNVDISL